MYRLLDQRDHFRIAIRDLLHHVTPVAPDRTEIEQHKAVLLLRLREDFVGPFPPLDLSARLFLRRHRSRQQHSQTERDNINRRLFPDLPRNATIRAATSVATVSRLPRRLVLDHHGVSHCFQSRRRE